MSSMRPERRSRRTGRSQASRTALAILLSFAMVLSGVPTPAIAEGLGIGEEQAEQVAQVPEQGFEQAAQDSAAPAEELAGGGISGNDAAGSVEDQTPSDPEPASVEGEPAPEQPAEDEQTSPDGTEVDQPSGEQPASDQSAPQPEAAEGDQTAAPAPEAASADAGQPAGEANETPAAEPARPAIDRTQELSVAGDTLTVRASVPEGAYPEGTTVEIASAEALTDQAVAATAAERAEDREVAAAYVLEIGLRAADGSGLAYDAQHPLRVSVKAASLADEKLDVQAFALTNTDGQLVATRHAESVRREGDILSFDVSGNKLHAVVLTREAAKEEAPEQAEADKDEQGAADEAEQANQGETEKVEASDADKAETGDAEAAKPSDAEKTKADAGNSTEASDSNKAKSDDAEKSASDDAEKTTPTEPEQPMPAFEQSQTVDGVTVTVQAEEGTFPEGAKLQVKSVPTWTEAIANAKVDQVRDTSREVAASYTFDIKVLDANGTEAQPADGKKVSVAFHASEVADESLSTEVFHIDSATGVAEQLEVAADAETATVEVDGFSIYVVTFAEGTQTVEAIAGEPGKVVTYEFWNGENKVQSQDVKAGDKLYEPSVPIASAGQRFTGWCIGEEKLNFGADGTTTIGTLHADENGVVIVTAGYEAYHYVTFYNQDNHVHSRIGVVDGGSIADTDIPAFSPKKASQTLLGWSATKGGTTAVSFPIANIKADATYYPIIHEKYVVSFDTNRSSAAGMAEDKGNPDDPDDDIPGVNVSYTAPLLVDPGVAATKPADPHAELSEIYTFTGWYKDSDCTTPYVWSDPVTKDITLYAGWNVGTTSYQVVVMKEKSSVLYGDPSRNTLTPGNYVFFKSQQVTDVSLPSEATVPTELQSFITPNSENADERGFELASYGMPTAKKVLPDGSTTLYIYWNRQVRTVEFYRLSEKTNTSTGKYGRYKKRTFYKSVTGLYGQFFSDYGFEWPAEYRWRENYEFYSATQEYAVAGSLIGFKVCLDKSEPVFAYTSGDEVDASYSMYFLKQRADGSWVKEDATMAKYQNGSFEVSNTFPNYTIVARSSGYQANERNRTAMSAGDTVTVDNNLYFYYARDKFNLTFYKDASSVLQTQQVYYEGTLPSAVPTITPDDDMVTFAGWSTKYGDTDSSNAFDFSNFTMPDYHINLYPILVKDAIKVQLVPGDGVTMDGKTEYWPMLGAPIDMTNMNNATKEGYELDGWYLPDGATRWTPGYGADLTYCDKDGNGDFVTYEDTVYGNTVYTITLTAHWRDSSEAPVRYVLGEGTGSVADLLIYVLNGMVKVSETEPTPPTGKIFVGWQDITGAIHMPGETFKFDTNALVGTVNGESCIVLTALYINEGVPTATITYDANYPAGATNVGAPSTTRGPLAFNERITLKGIDTFTCEGYMLDGWGNTAGAKDYDLDANVLVDNVVSGSNDNTLYGHWTMHAHNWVYTASGSIITATCDTPGHMGDPLKVTLTAPSATTYSGSAIEATATTDEDFPMPPGDSAAIIYTKDGQPLTGTPKDVGTYVASVIIGGKMASVQYEITKSAPIVTAPKANTLTYNDEQQQLVTAGSTSDGTIYYRLGTNGTWSTTPPSAKDAAEYEVYWYVTGDANHNDDSSPASPKGPIKVTIAKNDNNPFADGGGTLKAPTITGWTYGDTAETPTGPAVTFGSDEVEYEYYDSNGTKLNGAPTQAGSYTVKAVMPENGNHARFESAPASFEIAQKTLTFAWPEQSDLVYNGSEQTMAVKAEGGIVGVVGDDQVTLTYEGNTGTATGTYTAKVTALDATSAKNYKIDAATSEKSWKIVPASVNEEGGNVTSDIAGSYVYDATTHEPVVKDNTTDPATTLKKDGDKPDYTVAYYQVDANGDILKDSSGNPVAVDEPSAVGKMAVVVTFTENANFSGSIVKVVEVTARPVTFKGKSETKEYTGGEQSVTGYTASMGEAEGLVEGHVTVKSGTDSVVAEAKGAAVGTHDGTITAANAVKIYAADKDVTTNYLVTTVAGKLTITSVEPTSDKVTVSDTSASDAVVPVYDGNPHAPVVVDKAAGDKTLVEGEDYTVKYYAVGENGQPDTTKELNAVDAGEKIAVVTFIKDYAGTEEAPNTVSVRCDVARRPVTITGLGAADKTYDGNTGATITGTAAIDGAVAGDVVSVVAGSAAFADANVGEGKTVTFSGFSLSGDKAANYELTQPASVTANITKNTDMSKDKLTPEQKVTGKEGLVYNRGAQALVNAPVSELPEGYVKVQYSLDGQNYYDAIPTATNAATGESPYTVHVKYVGDVNHADFYGDDVRVPIAPKALATEDVAFASDTFIYCGSEQGPAITVTDGNATLTADEEYDVANAKAIEQGEHTVKVTGKGNYTGTVEKQFKIEAYKPGANDVLLVTFGEGQDTFTYNGQDQRPAASNVSVKLNDKQLEQGRDYDLIFPESGKSVDVGGYEVKVVLKGNYEGTAVKDYDIVAKQLQSDDVTATPTEFIYSGSPQGPVVTVKVGDKTLDAGTDYKLTGAEGTNKGVYTLVVTGQGNYSGTVEKTFNIAPYPKSENDKVEVSFTDAEGNLIDDVFTYNGSDQRPAKVHVTLTREDGDSVDLVAGTDFGLSYVDAAGNTLPADGGSVNADAYAVKIKLKNNYEGETARGYEIKPKPITEGDVTLGDIPEGGFSYTGSEQGPSVTVTSAEKELVKDGDQAEGAKADYTLTGEKAVNAGTCTVTVEGTGNYTGKVQKTFEIKKNTKTDAGDLTDTQKVTPKTDGENPLVYNGENQDLVVAPSELPKGYNKVQYSLVDPSSEGFDPETGWSDKIPTGKNAGDYPVYVRYVGDPNHADFQDGPVSTKIAPKPVTVTPDTAVTSKTYGRDDPAFTFTANGLVKDEALTGNLTRKEGEDAGEYAFDATALDEANPNYTVTVAEGAKFTIRKAALTVQDLKDNQKPTANTGLTYNGDDQALVTPPAAVGDVSALPDGYTKVQYSTDDGATWGDEVPTGINAKEYPIAVKYVGDENHVDLEITDLPKSVTIAPKSLGTGGENPVNAKDITVQVEPAKLTYNGKDQTPKITVKDGTTVLVKDVDYTLEGASGKDVGTYTVKVIGKAGGNYTGVASAQFSIVEQKVNGEDISISFEDADGKLLQDTFTYNGADQRPAADQVVVRVGETKLTLGKDYVLEYPEKGSIDAGSYAVKVKLMNNYSGEASKGYKIDPKPLTESDVTLTGTEMIYSGSPQGPTVTVKDGSKTLVEGESYTLADEEKTEQGTYTLTVSGTGNYTGTVKKQYTIKPYEVGTDDKLIVKLLDESGVEITEDYTYNGDVQKPAKVEVTLVKEDGSSTKLADDQFTATIPADSKNAGGYEVTVKLENGYSGTTSKGYKILPKPLTHEDIEAVFSDAEGNTGNSMQFVYSEGTDGGKVSQGPNVTVTDKGLPGDDKVLVAAPDDGAGYAISNGTATDAGTYTVTLTGTGNYTGTLTREYVINKRSAQGPLPGADDPTIADQTDTTITVAPTKPGFEYIVTTSETAPADDDWTKVAGSKGYYKENSETDNKEGHTFTGLEPQTQYYVHVRKAATPNEQPSEPKTTAAPTEPTPPNADAVKEAVVVNYDDESLTAKDEPKPGFEIFDPKADGGKGEWVTTIQPFTPGEEYEVRTAAVKDESGKEVIPPSEPSVTKYKAPDRPDAPAAVKESELGKSDITITVNPTNKAQEYIVLPPKADGTPYTEEELREAFEAAEKAETAKDGNGAAVVFSADANGESLQPSTAYQVYNRLKAVPAGTEGKAPAIASLPAGPTDVTTKTSTAPMTPDEQKAIADGTWDGSTANPTSIVVNGKDGYEYLVLPKGTPVVDVDWTKADKCPDKFPLGKRVYTKDSNGNEITADTDYAILVRKSETGSAMPSDPVTVPAYTTQEPPAAGEGYGVDYPGETITVEPGYEIVATSPEGTEPTEWAPNEKYPAAEDGTTVIPLTPGATYEVRKKADPDSEPRTTHESTPTSFTVGDRPATPAPASDDDLAATDTTVTVNPTDLTQEYVVLPVKRDADGKVVPYTDEEIANAMKKAGKSGTGEALGFTDDGNGDPIKPGQEYIVANRTKAVPATTDDEGNVVTDKDGKATGFPVSKPAQSNPVQTQHSTPAKPVLTADTTSVTVSPASAEQEYSIDGGKTWVTPEPDADGKAKDVVFGDLTPGQEYEVIARTKATDTGRASEPTEPVKVTTPKDQSGEAEKPTAGTTPTQITLTRTEPGQEYIIVPKGTDPSEADWSKAVRPGADGSVSFDEDANGDGLVPGAEYTVLTRVPGDATHEPGEPTSISVKTPRGAGADVMDGVNAEGGVAPMTDDKGSFITKDGRLVKKAEDGQYYYADKDGEIAEGAEPLEKGADGSLSDAQGKVEFQPAVMLVGTNPDADDNVKGKLDSLPEDDESLSVDLPLYDAREHAPSAYDNAVLDEVGAPKDLVKGTDYDVTYYRPDDIDPDTGLPKEGAKPLNTTDPGADDYAFDAGETVAVVQFKGDYAGTVAVPIKIERREFHVVTPSATKQFDGMPLTAKDRTLYYVDRDGNKVQDGLIGSQTVEVNVTGSLTNPGSSRNSFMVRFKGEAQGTPSDELSAQAYDEGATGTELGAQGAWDAVLSALGPKTAYADGSNGLATDGNPTAKRKNYVAVDESGTLTVLGVDVSGQVGPVGSDKRIAIVPTVDPANEGLADPNAVKGGDTATYTGKPIQGPALYDNDDKDENGNPRLLVEGTDYDVAYYEQNDDGTPNYDKPVTDPTNAGKYAMVVSFKGRYTGEYVSTVTIDPAELAVSTPSATKTYDGKALTQAEGAKLEGLVAGETATLKVTGSQTEVGSSKNAYAIVWDGSARERNYRVAKEDLGTLTVTAAPEKKTPTQTTTTPAAKTTTTTTKTTSSLPKTGDRGLPSWLSGLVAIAVAAMTSGLLLRKRDDEEDC